MGALIDIPIGGTWEDTPFIQSIYASFEWGVSYEFFGFKWGLTMQALLKSAYLKNQIGPVIASTSYSITIKFKKIFDILQLYLDGYATQNQWIFTCIPINGWGGTMADMMKSKLQDFRLSNLWFIFSTSDSRFHQKMPLIGAISTGQFKECYVVDRALYRDLILYHVF